MPRGKLERFDQVAIERTDERTVHGELIRQDEEYIVVKGTVGDNIGKEIFVPKERVLQIVVVKKWDGEDWPGRVPVDGF